MDRAEMIRHGPDAFTFEVLDLLEPDGRPGRDPAADLRALEELWVEELGLDDDSTY